MRRGEVWLVAGGPDYLGKPRPAVIIQADRFSNLASATICPMTSQVSDLDIFRLAIEPSARNGLRQPSQLMVDKIASIAKTKMGICIGELSDDDVGRLDQALLNHLDLAR